MERRQGKDMGSFGEDLKKAREAKGVTLEAVAAATKITTRYLQAVEREDFDQLPGGVFRKSIVRSYARAAGLDEDKWVERYLEATQEDTSFHEEDQAWMEFAQNVGRSRVHEGHSNDAMARWAGVAALLLLVIGMSWFVWGYVHNKAAAAAKPTGVSSALAAQSGAVTSTY
jgi:cytoskeleton protein RodZ